MARRVPEIEDDQREVVAGDRRPVGGCPGRAPLVAEVVGARPLLPGNRRRAGSRPPRRSLRPGSGRDGRRIAERSTADDLGRVRPDREQRASPGPSTRRAVEAAIGRAMTAAQPWPGSTRLSRAIAYAGRDRCEPGAEHHVLLQADRRVQPGLLGRHEQASGGQDGRQEFPRVLRCGWPAPHRARPGPGSGWSRRRPGEEPRRTGAVDGRPGQGARRDAQPVVPAADGDGREDQREP